MHGCRAQHGGGNRRSKKRLIARARWDVVTGWDYIDAIRKSGREPEPEDLPPDMDWEEPIWNLYEQIRTQWRVGPDRVIGLDYNPAMALIQTHGWRLEQALGLLQAVEMGFLEAWREKDGG
ncbi:MAG: DUF1799 domain-containing protein [Pseudomonadota bacterium]